MALFLTLFWMATNQQIGLNTSYTCINSIKYLHIIYIQTTIYAYRAPPRRHCVGGGAPVNSGLWRRSAPPPAQKNRQRRSVGGQKHFFKGSRKHFFLFSKIFFFFLVIEKINTPKIASAARRQNIGGGSSALITKSRWWRRSQIVADGGAVGAGLYDAYIQTHSYIINNNVTNTYIKTE